MTPHSLTVLWEFVLLAIFLSLAFALLWYHDSLRLARLELARVKWECIELRGAKHREGAWAAHAAKIAADKIAMLESQLRAETKPAADTPQPKD